jgi:hypothetical protein
MGRSATVREVRCASDCSLSRKPWEGEGCPGRTVYRRHQGRQEMSETTAEVLQTRARPYGPFPSGTVDALAKVKQA